jgi:hypothetical protein
MAFSNLMALRLKCLVILIAHVVLININPFTLESVSTCNLTPYLFFNNVQGIVKCGLPIS